MWPVVTGGVAWSVGLLVSLSVSHNREPCKNGWTDRDVMWGLDLGESKEPCIRWGPDPPRELAIWGGKWRPVVNYRDSLSWSVQKRLYWWRCSLRYWRHLANTIEPCVCDSDETLCQITLTTCLTCLLTVLTAHEVRAVHKQKWEQCKILFISDNSVSVLIGELF